MLGIGRFLYRALGRSCDMGMVRLMPMCQQKRSLKQHKTVGEIKQEKAREFLDNMDEVIVAKKTMMEAWIEEMRHRHNMVPKTIRDYDWKVILTELNSRTAVERYCRFMFLRECTETNEKAKRETKRKEREEKLQQFGDDCHQFSVPHAKRDQDTQTWARIRSMRYGEPVVMDMGYPELKYREMKQAFSQFSDVIAANKSHPQPFHLHVTSVRDNSVFSEYVDSKEAHNTMVDFHEKPFWEIFPREDLVYLTPDGPKLQGVNRNDIFVIGGIVDLHDSTPRSYIRAKELGIRMGSIPIHDYILLVKGQGLRLPLPHIYGIMLEYCLSHDWEQALLKYLPRSRFLSKNEEGLKAKIEILKSSNHPQMRTLREYQRDLLDFKVGRSTRDDKNTVDVKDSSANLDQSDDNFGPGRLSGSGRLSERGYKFNKFGEKREFNNEFRSKKGGKQSGKVRQSQDGDGKTFKQSKDEWMDEINNLKW